MVSHRKVGGLTVSIGASGLKFKKKPSAFNACVGKAMAGQPGPIHGGRYDREFQARFTAAVRSCTAPKETSEASTEISTKIIEGAAEASSEEILENGEESSEKTELTSSQSI